MSLFGLLTSVDLMTRFVMVILLLASVWSWAIIIDKVMLLKSVRRGMKKFEEKFWQATSLDTLYDSLKKSTDPMSAVFMAAMKEWRRSAGENGDNFGSNTQERVDRNIDLAIDRELSKLEVKMGFLASTGAVAPFLGLFGTVWGVMNVFHSIGASGNTNLIVIAPGIAEALYTTAMGLIAAIPAVLAYNKLSGDIDKIAKRLENFSTEIMSILTRRLDSTAGQGPRRGR